MMQMYLGCSRLQKKKIVKSVANSCVVVFLCSAFMRWAGGGGGGAKKQRPHSLCFLITVLFHTGLLNLAGGHCLPSHSPSEQGGMGTGGDGGGSRLCSFSPPWFLCFDTEITPLESTPSNRPTYRELYRSER